jgi:ribosome-binding protein aMBF1 (putative translation factor)
MTPEQSRAARAWLDWSQEELAAKASVSLSTVRDFEKKRRVPISNNLTAMKAVLEKAGISFVDSDGASGITFAKRKKR